jgi:hypothetical protein
MILLSTATSDVLIFKNICRLVYLFLCIFDMKYLHRRSRPVWTSSPDIAAGYNKLRAWVATAEAMAEKYTAPPPPIDFQKSKQAVRDKELIATLETFYTSHQPPPETYEMPTAEAEDSVETIAYLKELDTLNKEFLPVVEQEIDFYETTARTTAETTVFDMRVNYPLIHEEIEDELERREWFKDTGIGAGGK